MELLLNIVWLVIAMGLAIGLSLHHRIRTNKPSTFVVVVAIACTILLLFPAISLSDDLHSVTDAMEDSARKCVSIGSLVQPPAVPVAALYAQIHFEVALQPLPFWLRSVTPQQCMLDGYSSPICGRAPPSSLQSA